MPKRKTLEEFIYEANLVHQNKYIYTKSEYINSSTKICIICPIHGEFWQTPHMHLSGNGCPKCYNHHKFTTENFIEKSKEIHGDYYSYEKTEYIDYFAKLTMTCPIHGDFQITPSNHLRGKKRGCPKCHLTYSLLEQEIEFLLKEKAIEYIQHYNCKWLGKLSLDFYLPQYNAAIECQGKQHFGLGGWNKSYNFEEQFERDKRKYNLCLENGVKLLYFSNILPKFDYLDKVFTNKDELLKSL